MLKLIERVPIFHEVRHCGVQKISIKNALVWDASVWELTKYVEKFYSVDFSSVYFYFFRYFYFTWFCFFLLFFLLCFFFFFFISTERATYSYLFSLGCICRSREKLFTENKTTLLCKCERYK